MSARFLTRQMKNRRKIVLEKAGFEGSYARIGDYI